MKTLSLTVVLLALLGLGCSPLDAYPKADPDPIVGSWGVSLDDGCVAVLVFLDTFRYASVFSCHLQGGGVGGELEAGDWHRSGPNRVAFRPTQNSCPESMRSPEDRAITDAGAVVSKGQLTLVTSEAGIIFDSVPQTKPESGAVVFGCWDGDSFYPAPVTDL